ncbi:F-box/kelch-repeat protein-like [Dorcoceras hygrometricum]|uniref:F-box/kelch-repeat protein-like n=1 Tax=Dorcoceras hygrometricum TaxID=472368 RepID=A0A2Z7B8J0_9LAMI|nr:F-box/kelch-repeat protein-like [Dorcoceras hygrometricum]
MSLFDLQDVCMVIGSLATLDLSMVVDLIGIFVLKGPYCTLTMTDWFLQALSVIPRGSWGDVTRRFTMIRWGPNCYFGLGGRKNCFRIIMLNFVNCVDRSDLIVDRDYDGATVMDLKRMCALGLGPTQAH